MEIRKDNHDLNSQPSDEIEFLVSLIFQERSVDVADSLGFDKLKSVIGKIIGSTYRRERRLRDRIRTARTLAKSLPFFDRPAFNNAATLLVKAA